MLHVHLDRPEMAKSCPHTSFLAQQRLTSRFVTIQDVSRPDLTYYSTDEPPPMRTIGSGDSLTSAVFLRFAEAPPRKFELVLLQEAAVALDGLPAVVRLARRVDEALQVNAERARRLKRQVLPLHLFIPPHAPHYLLTQRSTAAQCPQHTSFIH